MANGTEAFDSPINTRFDPCPDREHVEVEPVLDELKRDTANTAQVMAVIAFVDDAGNVVLPHCYAVCVACHDRQALRKYGPEIIAEGIAQQAERDAR